MPVVLSATVIVLVRLPREQDECKAEAEAYCNLLVKSMAGFES